MPKPTLRSIGSVRLVIDLPAIEMREDRLFFAPQTFTKVRRFIRRSVPKTEEALEGGMLAISVRVLYWEHQGERLATLSAWKAGESMTDAVNAAAAELKRLRSVCVKENPAGSQSRS